MEETLNRGDRLGFLNVGGHRALTQRITFV